MSVIREEIAAQYTTISRLDQGIGLIMKELQEFGLMNDTLIMFTSDNGIPFPNGRTNFYETGIKEPLLMSNPDDRLSHGTIENKLVSLLDVTPTILDWFNITYPDYRIFHNKGKVTLSGMSLLSDSDKHEIVFGSHQHHEITMYYPMRFARTKRFKLIHNLNYFAPFPIDQDFYISGTFQDILSRMKRHLPLYWNKTLHQKKGNR